MSLSSASATCCDWSGRTLLTNEDRPHMALYRDAPIPRAVEPPTAGRVVALLRVAGLHHRYAGLHDPT